MSIFVYDHGVFRDPWASIFYICVSCDPLQQYLSRYIKFGNASTLGVTVAFMTNHIFGRTCHGLTRQYCRPKSRDPACRANLF